MYSYMYVNEIAGMKWHRLAMYMCKLRSVY